MSAGDGVRLAAMCEAIAGSAHRQMTEAIEFRDWESASEHLNEALDWRRIADIVRTALRPREGEGDGVRGFAAPYNDGSGRWEFRERYDHAALVPARLTLEGKPTSLPAPQPISTGPTGDPVTDTLSWALDIIDQYDERMAPVDGAERVYSPTHVKGKALAQRVLQSRVRRTREGADPDAVMDDPILDATDFAHPAWWRGELYGVEEACRFLNRVLDEGYRGGMRNPLGALADRLNAPVTTEGADGD